jgi:hypothetical protein
MDVSFRESGVTGALLTWNDAVPETGDQGALPRRPEGETTRSPESGHANANR